MVEICLKNYFKKFNTKNIVFKILFKMKKDEISKRPQYKFFPKLIGMR